MRRGDVYLADLEPARGSEADKTRPVVIVSGNHANRRAERLGRGVLTAVPLTSNARRLLPFQALVPAGEKTGLRVASKAQAEQVRSIDVSRLGPRLGEVPAEVLARLAAALRLHLQL